MVFVDVIIRILACLSKQREKRVPRSRRDKMKTEKPQRSEEAKDRRREGGEEKTKRQHKTNKRRK